MITPLRPFRRHALAAAIVFGLAGAAQAQLSTSTIKGRISSPAGVQAGLAVTAVNKANGNTYRTATLADGSYVLSGLAPGAYEIRVAAPAGTSATETITVQVGETAALDLDLGGATQQLVIIGSAQRKDVRTSEVGTNVSRKMIESLPQVTRNFLSSADLAPGVAFTSDGQGNTQIQSGAQNNDHVNVFIDGVSMKENVLRGGVSGQDSSRGNPFPQSAIAEYKVITQNYKAEFDQVSSAAITAITKSGGNAFEGEAYVDRTGTNWRAMTPFEKEAERQGVDQPPSKKIEYGFSLGGPIVQDRLHFFLAYDGKRIEDSRQVVPQNLDLLPADRGIVPDLIAAQGAQVDPFTEHLVFGKVDAQIDDDNKLTASFRVRRETDRRPLDARLSAPGNDRERSNDETRVDLAHEWSNPSWLAETRVGYDKTLWNPHSASSEPWIKYKVSPSDPPSIKDVQDVLFVGGSPDDQRRGQKSWLVSEDVTYTGAAGHVIKGGMKVKTLKYTLSGTAFAVDAVDAVIDQDTGLPYYDGTNCTGTNIINNGADSDQCHILRAVPPAEVSFRNTQIGLYIQDDWSITKQIEVNLGIRWDYETNMLNNDYVTPADRVAAIFGPDGERWGITSPPGQTYDQALAKGGVRIEDYIADGKSRKPFKRAFAPRVGASYDVFGDRASVVFGGWGRSYDRTVANNTLDELQKNAQAGGEIWLIRNDFKMPYADQFTLGLRQAAGIWNTEIAVSRVVAKNQFIWFGGNRDPNGGYATQSPIDPLWGGPPGYGTLILGDFVGETKTDALFVKAEKPYSQASGWGFNLAYTYSDAKTTNKEWANDIFDWTYGRSGRGWNPSTLVDRHRLVAAGVVDGLLPWGLTFSAKATYASGKPRRITDCSDGFSNCVYVEGDAPSYRQVDIGFGKVTTLFGGSFTLRADVLNVFNTVNYGGFDDWGGGPPPAGQSGNAVGGDNPNLGKPNAIRGDPRTLRVMLGVRF